jgi:hypothetical protein
VQGIVSRNAAFALPIGNAARGSWYDALASLFGRCQGAIAGLSTDADLLIAKSLAREAGFLSVFEGRHDARNADRVRHHFRVWGNRHPAKLWLPGADAEPAQLAERLASLSYDMGSEWIEIEGDGVKHPDHPGYLTSWMFCPPNRNLG